MYNSSTNDLAGSERWVHRGTSELALEIRHATNETPSTRSSVVVNRSVRPHPIQSSILGAISSYVGADIGRRDALVFMIIGHGWAVMRSVADTNPCSARVEVVSSSRPRNTADDHAEPVR